MRFDARHIGSGVWGVWDSATNAWRATDLSQSEAQSQAMDLDVVCGPYGQRDDGDRREVHPPVPIDTATWESGGELDWWVRERRQWWGRVRAPDGTQRWVRAEDLRARGGPS